MSLQALTAAWALEVSPPARKLVLLFMANAHNASTGKLNPSVDAVARGCGITACQARRHLHALIDAGLLEVTANANGGPPTATRSYRLNIDTPSADATPSTNATPSAGARDPSHPCTPPLASMRVTPSTGASQTGKNRKEPEGNRNIERERSVLSRPADVSESVWQDFTALRRAKRSPLTTTGLEGIRKEAQRAGLALDAALAECCMRGWPSLKADWVAGPKVSPSKDTGGKFNPTAYVNDPAYRKAWDSQSKAVRQAADQAWVDELMDRKPTEVIDVDAHRIA
jgi:hypothetical protein